MRVMSRWAASVAFVTFGLMMAIPVLAQAPLPSQPSGAGATNNSTPDFSPLRKYPSGHGGGPASSEELAAYKALFADADRHVGEAKKLLRAGKYQEAEQACLAAFAAAPVIDGKRAWAAVPFADYTLGEVYLRAGEYEKAAYWLDFCSRTTSTDSLPYDIPLAYLRAGAFEVAQQRFPYEEALRSHSNARDLVSKDLPGTDTPEHLEASILFMRARGAYNSDSLDEKLADYAAAAKIAPRNAMIATDYADALEEKMQYAEAEKYLKVAVRYGRKPFVDYANKELITVRWYMEHPPKNTVKAEPAQKPTQAPALVPAAQPK